MPLHTALADLARDHGHELFRDATAFRGSLDDYLDEGQASSGTINLLTDAVRLGALDGMLTMLNSGASPADAVESAGQRMARDRGSADVRGCQWAVAVLGFALGKVGEDLVTGLDPDAGTARPPFGGPGGASPAQPPMPPITSPVQPPMPPIVSPVHQPGQHSGQQSFPPPASQPGAPGYGQSSGYPAPSYAAGSWSQQPPAKKSKTVPIVAAAVIGALVLVLAVVGIVLASSGNDDDTAGNRAGDDNSSSTESSQPSESESSDAPSEEASDLGGPTIEGLGYQVSVPKGWTDGTEEFIADNPGLTTLDRVILWGTTFGTARGNVIVETQSSYGYDDPNDLKDDWKEALVSSDPTASVIDIPDIALGGKTALGVDIDRTNDAGVKVSQRSLLVISGDKGYSITVSLKDGDDQVLATFEKILTTWQWDE